MSHRCHLPSCREEVPPRLLMCKRHWFMVPKPLRDAVWREYRPGQEEGNAPVTKEYLQVAQAAIAAVQKKIEDKRRQGELF